MLVIEGSTCVDESYVMEKVFPKKNSGDPNFGSTRTVQAQLLLEVEEVQKQILQKSYSWNTTHKKSSNARKLKLNKICSTKF